MTDDEQVAADLEEALDEPVGRLAHDVGLKVIDLVTQSVEDREVAVDEPVRKCPKNIVRPGGEMAPFVALHERRGARFEVGIVRGKQEAPAKDDVDLVADDLALVGQAEHDQVQGVAGALDLGPLITLENVLDDQRMEPKQRAQLGQQLATGTLEVDPHLLIRSGIGGANLGQRLDLAQAGGLAPGQRP